VAGRRGGFFGKLLLALAVVAVLAGGLFAAAASLLPRARLEADLERVLSDRLGRQVRIDGGLGLTLWPAPGLAARDVHVANVAGGVEPDLLSARELDVGVALLPLLQGRVELRRIRLVAPLVRLEKTAAGTVNWKLGPADRPASRPEWLKDMRLDALTVEQGSVSFRDGAAGTIQAVSQVQLKTALKSLDAPMRADGSLWWKGRKVDLGLVLPRPRELFEGRRTALELKLDNEALHAALNGFADPATGVLEGALVARGPSLRDLMAWTGKPAAGSGPGLGLFSASGRLRRDGRTLRLDGARLELDRIAATGDLALDLARARPFVTGRLAFGPLALGGAAAGQPAPAGGWSQAPLRFSGLDAVDGQLIIAADSIGYGRWRLDGPRLALGLNGGRADLRIASAGLSGGVVSGRIVAWQAGANAHLATDLVLSGVQVQPFLQTLAGMNRVEGTARVQLAVSGAGATQTALMRSLSGRASVSVANGAIRGVDLARVSQEISSVLTGGATGPDARTPFSELAGDFAVAGGVAHTRNLRLVTPVMRLDGVGRIDLGARTLDLLIRPVGASTGFRGRRIGVAVPFRVTGPWDKPRYAPDLAGVAEGVLKGEMDRLFGRDDAQGGGLLDRLRPKGKPAEKGQDDQRKDDPLSEMLKAFPRR
jgi:AsmA protein